MKKKPKNFLQTRGQKIVWKDKEVRLRGVNTGGWLMMEGYIMQARNLAVQIFKKEFAEVHGEKALVEFEKKFNDTFIQEKDFRSIARQGFNSVRVPFHHGLIEKKPYKYDRKGLAYLEKAVSWARKYKLWVILDLHAAPGSQNNDWHSDSLGPAELWTDKENRQRVYALWEYVADRFRDEPAVAGYDLLNEAVMGDARLLNEFYNNVISAIRKVDANHMLFIEGNRWAQEVDVLDDFGDPNWVMSVHFYIPLEFTFNLIPHLRYPLKTFGPKTIRNFLKRYQDESRRRNVPVHVGEFGVNYRQGKYNEDRWLKDTLKCFHDYGFHWNYWTYKAVKNGYFPDGVYSYLPNPPWVRREGPKFGWENYADCWPKHKKDIVASWDTKHFTGNKEILQLLRQAARRK